MSMNYKEVSLLGLKQAPQYAAGFQIVGDVVKTLHKQGLLPDELDTTVLREQVPPVDSLKQVVGEFVTSPHTPELYTATFQQIWRVRQERLMQGGTMLDLEVAKCPYTQEEIDELEAEDRRPGVLPFELSTQANRYLLGELWPNMRSYSVERDHPVTNGANRHGWFDYDAQIDAPYTNTTEDKLREAIEYEERFGMDLNEYIVAGQDSKLLTRKYLDQDRTYVRLLDSRRGGNVVRARFHAGGYLLVYWDLDPRARGSDLGGRSVGVPKAA